MRHCHLSVEDVPCLEVTAPCRQEVVVGMPVQAEDGGAERLLDVLTHPPTHKHTALAIYMSYTHMNMKLSNTRGNHLNYIIRLSQYSPIILLLKVADGD